METFFLTLYVLIWPVVVAGVLFVVCRAFISEVRQARREGRDIV
ncbi:MAG: putative transporter small subunit [Homoserinimonas sp.]